MVVGRGDIAQVLIEEGVDRPDIIYFASGVSNSSEKRVEEFQREIDLLASFNTDLHLVYFSSLCIYYSESPYANHKRNMEMKVRNRFKTSTIVRIGNITWGTNKNTILNFFRLCSHKGIVPDLQDTYRSIIGKSDLLYWVGMIKPGINDIMNITGETVHVKEIWRRVCNGEY